MSLLSDAPDLLNAISRVREPVDIVRDNTDGRFLGLMLERGRIPGTASCLPSEMSLVASLPAIYPEWLGDRNFLDVHRVR